MRLVAWFYRGLLAFEQLTSRVFGKELEALGCDVHGRFEGGVFTLTAPFGGGEEVELVQDLDLVAFADLADIERDDDFALLPCSTTPAATSDRARPIWLANTPALRLAISSPGSVAFMVLLLVLWDWVRLGRFRCLLHAGVEPACKVGQVDHSRCAGRLVQARGVQSHFAVFDQAQQMSVGFDVGQMLDSDLLQREIRKE